MLVMAIKNMTRDGIPVSVQQGTFPTVLSLICNIIIISMIVALSIYLYYVNLHHQELFQLQWIHR